MLKTSNSRDESARRTDEDGKILTGCGKCRHKRSCDISEGLMQCPYENGIALHYVFHIGKYKGKTVERVIADDPQYLLWMTANVKWFELSALARKALVNAGDGYGKKVYEAEVRREENFFSHQIKQDGEDEIVHGTDGAEDDAEEQ